MIISKETYIEGVWIITFQLNDKKWKSEMHVCIQVQSEMVEKISVHI